MEMTVKMIPKKVLMAAYVAALTDKMSNPMVEIVVKHQHQLSSNAGNSPLPPNLFCFPGRQAGEWRENALTARQERATSSHRAMKTCQSRVTILFNNVKPFL